MKRTLTIKMIKNYYNMNIVIILFSILFGCKGQADESLYLIPENYRGTVIIIFNQRNGAPVQYKNGKRLYRIPANGILKTQFKANFGISKFHFLYNNYTDLKYFTSQDWSKYSDDSEQIVCWNLESGVTQDSNNRKINFEVFSVGPIKESEKISDQKGEFLRQAFKR